MSTLYPKCLTPFSIGSHAIPCAQTVPINAASDIQPHRPSSGCPAPSYSILLVIGLPRFSHVRPSAEIACSFKVVSPLIPNTAFRIVRHCHPAGSSLLDSIHSWRYNASPESSSCVGSALARGSLQHTHTHTNEFGRQLYPRLPEYLLASWTPTECFIIGFSLASRAI
jgi:hypothetical protein